MSFERGTAHKSLKVGKHRDMTPILFKKIKDNFSHSYNYFVENSDKYVKSKILTKDEIILKCKSKLWKIKESS